MTTHCEMPELTFSESRGRFEVWYMGWREASQNRPLRMGHDTDTASQRLYRRGYEARKAYERGECDG